MKGLSMTTRMMSGAVVCVIIAFIAVVLQAGFEEAEKQNLVTPSSNALTELRAALEEIVAIHEAQFKYITNNYAAGRVSYADVISANVKLAKAKVRLAQNLGETDNVIRELRSILALREKALSQSTRNFSRGETTAAELNTTKIDLLEAKVSLYTAIISQH
jgi:outer membrane protein TolC